MTTSETNRGSEGVVLLGAGASVEAGLPTSTQLTTKIMTSFRKTDHFDLINYVVGILQLENRKHGLSVQDGVDCERLFSALEFLAHRDDSEAGLFTQSWSRDVELLDRGKPHATTETENLVRQIVETGSRLASSAHDQFFDSLQLKEQFVNAVESQVQQSRSSRFQAAATAVKNSLVDLVRLDDDASVDHLRPIAVRAQSIPQLTVASLNYDLAFERACRLEDTQFDTGIANRNITDAFNFDNAQVAFLKLHGSIDWKIERMKPSDGVDLSIDWVMNAPAVWPNPQPAVIFGRGNKLTAKGPYLRLFRILQQRMELTNHLIIVGYSFRDEHINEAISYWFNGSKLRCITIVSPSSFAAKDQVFGREVLAQRTSGRVRHLKAVVKTALDSHSWWDLNEPVPEEIRG